MNKLDYALQFINQGISVIPLHHRSKMPALRAWEPYQNILSTSTEIYQWLASGWNNYGVVCGWDNLVVIDFDSLEYFSLWCMWLHQAGMGCISETSFKVVTARGMHVYLRTSDAAYNEKRIGIDVQAQRRFVVGPGCLHPSGTQYVPVGELHLVQVESVQRILPIELFPRVAVCNTASFQGAVPQLTTNNTEYDPFQAAMFPSALDLIDTVKSRVRIETLFVDVRRTSADGRWFAALCPFHDDHNPSLWIDARRQLCGCQVCGMKPMDCINLYSRMHNISESDAVRAMAEELGVWR